MIPLFSTERSTNESESYILSVVGRHSGCDALSAGAEVAAGQNALRLLQASVGRVDCAGHWNAAVLLVDIFHSRRAVFVLLVLTAIAVAIFVKGRSVWLSTLILLPTGIAAVVIYVLVTSKVDSIGRFLTTLLHW